MKPSLAIFGLGNPGKTYENTRHNAGYLAMDILSEEYGEGEWIDRPKFFSDVQEARIGVVPVLLVKPKTYMNLSGDAVRRVVDFYKLDASEQILILSDDIDIPFGELRMRQKGGPGTHNGLKSIVASFGEEFPRIRIGLGNAPANAELSGWVLSRFTKEERDELNECFSALPEMVREFVMEGNGEIGK